MDFELSDEQRLTQETVRAFVDERVLPVAVANDIEHKLDLDLIQGMAELGLLGIVIPDAYGGAGLDFVAEALACEEIERGEAAFRTLISVHVGLNSLSILRYGTEEQKQRWLTPQARGEKLACFGLTEPGAGSDVAALRTTARREGDAYVLNGQKNWISYASVADHALVFAKTDPEAGHKGISAFLLEKGMPGFSARDQEHKLGIWAGSTGELFFENVEVPAENRLGEEGQGFEIAMYSLDQGRFTVAAGACGVIRACLERSTSYARERQTFGQEIGRHQFVQDMIATMVLGYETSKLLVMQAAWMKDQGRRSTRETSLAKWHATESAFEAAHLAVQVFGSYGYSGEVGIERYFRNARAPIIYEGTTQIHKLMQAEHALGYRRLNGSGEASPLCSWAPALSPAHRRRSLELPVPVVDRVLEPKDLVERPHADLAAVGIDRGPDVALVGENRDPRHPFAAVRHLVRAVRPLGEEDDVAGRELVLAVGVAQRRTAAEHDQPFLEAVLVVVRADALSGGEVVHRRAERRSAEQRPHADVRRLVAGRVVVVALGLDVVEVHSPSQ